jgi:PAS domain S-box-containing protein
VSLRSKTVIVVATAAVIVVGFVFAFSQVIFMRSFQSLENSNTSRAVEQISSVLSDRINNLNTLNHDWSAWDDTYNFVQDPIDNVNYVEVNPTDTTFASAELNYIFILDKSGRPVYSKAFDLTGNKEVPVPNYLMQNLFSSKLLDHNNVDDSISGVILLPEGPLLVSSQPIITSQGQGPIMGTIIMAQYLDSTVINTLSNTAHLPLDVVSINDGNMPAEYKIALSSFTISAPVFTHIVNSKSIEGYTLLNDIYGKPAIIIRTTVPRDIYAKGTSTMRYLLITLLLMAVLLSALLYYALGKLVISRVGRIGRYVSDIGRSADLSKHLPAEGNDELSRLSQNLNKMVDTLQQSHQDLLVKQQTEERLRLTIESVAEGIASTDLEGNITDVNDSKVRLHGYSEKEELIGKNALDLVSPEDLPKAKENMSRALQTGFSGGGEYVMLKKDGSRFIGERSTALLKNAEGRPIGFVISTKDITARKRAEELYSTIVEKSNDAIVIIQDNVIKFVNSKMLEVTGLTAEESLGRPMADILSPKYRSIIVDRHNRRVRGESLPDKYEAEIISRSGQIIPIEISVSVIQYDGSPATVSIVRDVRERKLAQEQLQKSEEKYSTIVEKGNDGIVILQEGEIKFANSRIQSLTGFTNKETTGKSFIEFVSQQFRPFVIEMYRRRTAGEEVPGRYEISISTKNGKEMPVEVNANRIDFEGKPADMAIIRDITERKRAADELAKLNEELKSFNLQLESKVEERTRQLEEAVSVAEASNKTKSEFLASMSHELRTPLNAIIGFSQVLHERYFGDLNEKQSEYVADIVDSGKHLLSLINDVLDLSKIEAGKMELEVTEVKIADLLQNSLVMIKEKALSHSISLDLQIADNINGTKIAADERRLKQVMFNLLSNSAKFTPDGGSIKVEASKGEKELVISVSDTGIGMTPQEQKRLFEAFYQASGGIKGKTPGTGLGLAITKSIVEKHGGKIWMESEGPNKGSKFTFTLPLG